MSERREAGPGRGSLFDVVVAEYDAARPAYPGALFDALDAAVGGLAGLDVLEGGAGTGLATRDLVARQARVVGWDVSSVMLSRAAGNVSGMMPCVADGNALPFASASADVMCFAQSWHWLDATRAIPELLRVLRPAGWWAGWWSHPRGDGEPWFDKYQDLLERHCPAYDRKRRDVDWSADLVDSGGFVAAELASFPWERRVPLATWIDDEISHSYVVALPDAERAALLDAIRAVLLRRFPEGEVAMPYATWMWVLARRSDLA